MIGAILRIVFENEDRAVPPESGLRDRLHNHAQSMIVVGDWSERRQLAALRSLSMVRTEAQQDQRRQLAALFVLGELTQEHLGPLAIRIIQIQAAEVVIRERLQSEITGHVFDLNAIRARLLT